MIRQITLQQFLMTLVLWILAFSVFLLVQQANITTLLLAGLVAFVLIVFILIKPYLGLVFMYGTLPLYIFTDLPGGFTFTSATGIIGGLTLISYIWHNKGKPFQKIPDVILYVCIALLALQVLIQEYFVSIYLDRFFFLTYAQLLVLIWLTLQVLRTKRQIETLMVVFISANLIALMIALKDFEYFISGDAGDRLAGLAGNANEFSIYLGVTVLMLYYFIDQASNQKVKIILLAITLVLIIPIVLSGSRAGFLFILPIMGFQLWRFQRKKIALLVGIFIMIIFTVSYLPGFYLERILQIPTNIINQSDTIGLRYGLWRYALELWMERPIWGIGTGMYLIRSIDSPVLSGGRMLQAHSLYITHLVENGIIGLVLFLLILLKSILNYERAIRVSISADNQLHKLAITWEAILVLYALNGLKGNLNTNKLLWLTFGLSMVFFIMTKAIKNTYQKKTTSHTDDQFGSLSSEHSQ